MQSKVADATLLFFIVQPEMNGVKAVAFSRANQMLLHFGGASIV